MWKKVLKIAASTLLALVVLLWANKAYRDAHYFDNYDASAPLNVTAIEATEVNTDTPEKGYTITKFTFDGYEGEKVPTLISMPTKPTDKKLPVVIFLHGIGQNKNFMKDITAPFNEAGFAFVSFDQYTKGERKLPEGASLVAEARAFIERPAKTVNETRRLVDYLTANSDIDPQRIYLVGASYGAITGSTVLAKEKRIRAGALVFGGGDYRKLFDSHANHLGIAVMLGMIDEKSIDPENLPLPELTASQERKVGLVIGCIIPVLRYFLGVADPIYYVDQISPTPVYFQAGKYDSLVPAEAAQALMDAAGEPKKITWYDMEHVGFDVEDTVGVLRDGLQWILEQDDAFRAPDEKVSTLPEFDLSKF